MGWDLCSRSNTREFHVLMYDWPRLCMTLDFLGADVTEMAEYNDGSYVPARVADSWADAIERGIDSLKMAIVKDTCCSRGEGYFIVPLSYSEEDAQDFVEEYYDGPEGEHRSVAFLRLEPLSDRMRQYLLRFAKFCRKSRGFEQW